MRQGSIDGLRQWGCLDEQSTSENGVLECRFLRTCLCTEHTCRVDRRCLLQISQRIGKRGAELTSEQVAFEMLCMQIGFGTIRTRKLAVSIFRWESSILGRAIHGTRVNGDQSGSTGKDPSSSL